MKRITYLLLLLAALYSCAQPDFRNTELTFEQRADDLLSRMTVQEKADFIRYDSPENKRLGIPAYNHWNECLHGVARSGIATVFPQAIGMAAMWDTTMMHEIATAISDEGRAKYQDYSSRGKRGIYMGLTYWTPNINIFRDPRWGRGMETYGEDPYLSGELAVPFIRGLQGDDPKYFKSIATAKHFAVHSGPESTRHSANVEPSDYDFLETYTPHFHKAVTQGNVYSVMCAYQRLNGLPCCGNKYLSDLLRNEWNFDGYIVTDCWAIADFYNEDAHHIMDSPAEAAAMAVRAGSDLNCGVSYRFIPEAVEKGLLTEEDLNVAVKRVILARMRLGQFDPDSLVPYTKIPLSVLDSKEHRELADEAARKSMVLLKNDRSTLPFSKKVKKVAVIGPNADNSSILLANYHGFPSSSVTPLEGIRAKLPDAEVTFAQGCTLAEGLPYLTVIPTDYLYTDSGWSIFGLNAEYFDNKEYKGEPKERRLDPNVNFEWGANDPLPGISYENFSVRWSGFLVPPVTGEYSIGGECCSQFVLTLNGKEFVKGLGTHESFIGYEKIHLEAQVAYPITLAYNQTDTEHPMMRLLWDMPDQNLEQEAVDAASDADVVILCMGLSPQLEGEEMKVEVDGFEGGDRTDIKLPEVQTALMKKIMALHKPTALVLLNGSALAINWENENVPAILEAWYPGQGGGTAVADILFGDYNPAGRLPVTFYKDVKDLPPFDGYDMAGRTYRYFKGKPLYPFGYGLSYTTFKYSVPKTIQAKIGETVSVTVEVKNTGKMDGEDVVQLYVSHPKTALKSAIRSLQGFDRIFLKAGESRKVAFTLTPEQLSCRDAENSLVQDKSPVLLTIGDQQVKLEVK